MFLSVPDDGSIYQTAWALTPIGLNNAFRTALPGRLQVPAHLGRGFADTQTPIDGMVGQDKQAVRVHFLHGAG